MPKFFIDDFEDDFININGENFYHIVKSLRMKKGDFLNVCDKNSIDYLAEITKINKSDLLLKKIKTLDVEFEPKIYVELFLAFPKSDKFENVLKSVTELGVSKITPFISKAVVKKPNNFINKYERYKKIIYSACEQSYRSRIPTLSNLLTFKEFLIKMQNYDKKIIFYEKKGNKISDFDFNNVKKLAIVVGCEGGFFEEEIKQLEVSNIFICNLGKRILRCETAATVCSALVMSYSNNL